MALPAIRGVIRRRILVNFRVDPEVMQRQLPEPFRPKLLGDAAVAGICLIRLERMRPPWLPLPIGLGSENAAHRVAVCWTDEEGRFREGVYIPRRDTNSPLNALAGGRLFPGSYQRARFDVRDDGERIDFSMQSLDGSVAIRLQGSAAEALPVTSKFPSLEAASTFFEEGAVGYSATENGARLDGMKLFTEEWHVEPLALESVHSSYFADEAHFPPGSVAFDCALLMRDIRHEWRRVSAFRAEAAEAIGQEESVR